jgi:thymidylate synthase (FAD)
VTNQFKVKLVSATQTEKQFAKEIYDELVDSEELSADELLAFEENIFKPEAVMAYAARVSSPKQANPKFAGLLKYCIDHKHWSVFEMVDATIEITTSRAIAQQILRHRSFSFQEFSQRYAAVPKDGFIVYEARRQDQKNRQNSVDDLSEFDKKWFEEAQRQVWHLASTLYQDALNRGIAKECARFLLPLNTKTKLYMKGSLRSWIHYCELRCAHGTQKEHKDIADAAMVLLAKKFPITTEALGWNQEKTG